MVKYIQSLLFIGLIFSMPLAQDWQQSFVAGNMDLNESFMGGSEVLNLVTHKDKIFASLGYWEDENNIWYGGDDLNLGWAQVIRLDNIDGQWEVDYNLGLNHVRPEVLKKVIFTKDHNGDALDTPDTLLIVGAYSPNYLSGLVTASIFIRNDNNGEWEQIVVYEGGFPASENYSMRDLELYTDQITGIEHLIISVGTKGIFTGKYNLEIDGKIELNIDPEIGPLSIRPLGITIANNDLYFSSGNKIFKRNDGLNPTYDVVHHFADLSSNINSAVGGIRGLSTIPNPSGVNESILLMWCPDSQSKGTIFRLDNNGSQEFDRVYETKISLLVEDYLPGSTVPYLLGAYNEFYPVTDPITNELNHIVGIESLLQGGNYPTWNGFYRGALFVTRNSSAEYEIEEINGYISSDDAPLVAIRCYVESPFENESATYFGGFDPNSFSSTNRAWIYKKSWNSLDIYKRDHLVSNSFKIEQNYPNPFNPATQLNYTLYKQSFVNITIFDISGKIVKNLKSQVESSGYQTSQWNGMNNKGHQVSSGIYLYMIDNGDYRETKKMMLIR